MVALMALKGALAKGKGRGRGAGKVPDQPEEDLDDVAKNQQEEREQT